MKLFFNDGELSPGLIQVNRQSIHVDNGSHGVQVPAYRSDSPVMSQVLVTQRIVFL